MALMIIDKKVIYVAPPKKLSEREREIFEQAPIHQKLIKRATKRKYKIV